MNETDSKFVMYCIYHKIKYENAKDRETYLHLFFECPQIDDCYRYFMGRSAFNCRELMLSDKKTTENAFVYVSV